MIEILKIRGVIFDWGRTLFDNKSGGFFPETPHVVDFLRKTYPLAIVSVLGDTKEGEKGLSSVQGRLDALEKSGLRDRFDRVLFTEDKKGKPELICKVVMDSWRRKPEEILIVDDRMLQLAWPIRLGFQTAWLMRGKFAEEFPDDETGNPGLVITSLTDLLELFEEFWRRP